jgi:hypothetical protein
MVLIDRCDDGAIFDADLLRGQLEVVHGRRGNRLTDSNGPNGRSTPPAFCLQKFSNNFFGHYLQRTLTTL